MLKTVLFAALAIGSVTGDKVAFDWKPEKGQTANYKFTNVHQADFGGGPQELVIAWTSKISVDKVDGKKVWLKLENGEPTATIGGANADGVQVQIADQTEEHALDGKFFAANKDEHMGFGLYSGFRLPNKPLEAGESYEIEGLKAKYVGVEKVGDWEAHKFEFENRPSKNPGDQWSKGEIWLSTKDLSLVRRKASLNNIDFGMGPDSITNEVLRTK